MARLVKTNMARTQKVNEPPWAFRKLISVSKAATACLYNCLSSRPQAQQALVSACVGGFIGKIHSKTGDCAFATIS